MYNYKYNNNKQQIENIDQKKSLERTLLNHRQSLLVKLNSKFSN